MAQRCDVSEDGINKCGSGSHCVVRPTKGHGDKVICYNHQQKLARGLPVVTLRGAPFYLPKSSRVGARIRRGGIMSLEVEIKVPGQLNEHVLEVRVENYKCGRPAIISGPPENWEPSEGAEYDVVSVVVVRGSKRRELPRKMADEVAEYWSEYVVDALDLLTSDTN